MIIEPNEIQFRKTQDGQRIGLTSGVYDLLHFYHLHYLQRCRALCDVLIVGVDSDDLVKRNKSTLPTIPEYHRLSMIAALKCVDVAFALRSLNDLKTVGKFSTHLFKNGPAIYGTEIVGAETAELVIVEDVQEIQSTTELKEKIRNASK